jgi:hypothetical protein
VITAHPTDANTAPTSVGKGVSRESRNTHDDVGPRDLHQLASVLRIDVELRADLASERTICLDG